MGLKPGGQFRRAHELFPVVGSGRQSIGELRKEKGCKVEYTPKTADDDVKLLGEVKGFLIKLASSFELMTTPK